MSSAATVTSEKLRPAHPAQRGLPGGSDHDLRETEAGDLTLAICGRWVVISEPVGCGAAWQKEIGQPGLWKVVQGRFGPQRVFEMPRWIVSDPSSGDFDDASAEVLMQRLVAWALGTRRGTVPRGWAPPDAALVESWMSCGALTVQAGGSVRQGELLLRPDRWAVRMPIVQQLAPDLPEPRLRALEQLVTETQRSWAMVRLGLTTDHKAAALVAEVDFTGAPHSEPLFLAGLDVLRHVTSQVQETADVLSDATVAIACLAGSETTNTTCPERSKTI